MVNKEKDGTGFELGWLRGKDGWSEDTESAAESSQFDEPMWVLGWGERGSARKRLIQEGKVGVHFPEVSRKSNPWSVWRLRGRQLCSETWSWGCWESWEQTHLPWDNLDGWLCGETGWAFWFSYVSLSKIHHLSGFPLQWWWFFHNGVGAFIMQKEPCWGLSKMIHVMALGQGLA